MIPDRYNRHGLVKALQNPKLLLDEIVRVQATLERKLKKKQFQRNMGKGTNFFEKDWDNLIILDACRYDIFEKINTIGGDLSYKISKGSHSEEFYQKTSIKKNIMTQLL